MPVFNTVFSLMKTSTKTMPRWSKDGVTLLIDSLSYQYLVGAEIDFKEDLTGAQFEVRNPNVVTTCGCGSSFFVLAGYNAPKILAPLACVTAGRFPAFSRV